VSDLVATSRLVTSSTTFAYTSLGNLHQRGDLLQHRARDANGCGGSLFDFAWVWLRVYCVLVTCDRNTTRRCGFRKQWCCSNENRTTIAKDHG
jgi:hypothetical protein